MVKGKVHPRTGARLGWMFKARLCLALPLGKARYPLKRGWLSPMAGLDGCGKSLPNRDSIPELSSPYRVAILTELSRQGSKVVPSYFLVVSDHCLLSKSKEILLEPWTGLDGSRRLRLPDFKTPVAFTPGNIPGTHFC